MDEKIELNFLNIFLNCTSKQFSKIFLPQIWPNFKLVVAVTDTLREYSLTSKSQCYKTYFFFTDARGNKLVGLSEVRII